MARYAINVPLNGRPLAEQRDWIERAHDLGYSDLWSSESVVTDGFTPIAAAAAWNPSVRVGAAIVPVYSRGPGILAMTAAGMADLAPGRFVLGLGSSSPMIVENWNGGELTKPYQRVRDTLRFLKRALAGERVDEAFETFAVKRFRLLVVPKEPPKIFIAALREQMCRLAGREADGAILNQLSPEDAKRLSGVVKQAGPDTEIAARITVIPTEDLAMARELGRRALGPYLGVPSYAEHQRACGRSELLGRAWELLAAGDLKGGTAAIPDEVVDAVTVMGRPEECREQVLEFIEAGVETPILSLHPTGQDEAQILRRMAP